MDIQTLTDHEGQLFIRREDVVTLLRDVAVSYLQHIPAHLEAGEYIEAAFDKHADAILVMAADQFERISTPLAREQG